MNKRSWNIIKLNVILTLGMELAKIGAEKIGEYCWPDKDAKKEESKVKKLKKALKTQVERLDMLSEKFVELINGHNIVAKMVDVHLKEAKDVEPEEDVEPEDEEEDEE